MGIQIRTNELDCIDRQLSFDTLITLQINIGFFNFEQIGPKCKDERKHQTGEANESAQPAIKTS